MIVAIDGPAGSGKSTTAREVARRLGFRHLDSGAFYRALTLGALRGGIAIERWPGLTATQLDALDVRAVPAEGSFRMTLNGEAVDAEIRAPEINAHVSAMARVPAVRTWLLGRLRAAAEGVDLVSEGRDVGTVVFPHAELKVFLVADPATRARRRLLELGLTDPSADDLAAERERLLRRDRIDTERDVAPLRKAADAVEIDTSTLSFDEQVGRIVELVEQRRTAFGTA